MEQFPPWFETFENKIFKPTSLIPLFWLSWICSKKRRFNTSFLLRRFPTNQRKMSILLHQQTIFLHDLGSRKQNCKPNKLVTIIWYSWTCFKKGGKSDCHKNTRSSIFLLKFLSNQADLKIYKSNKITPTFALAALTKNRK